MLQRSERSGVSLLYRAKTKQTAHVRGRKKLIERSGFFFCQLKIVNLYARCSGQRSLRGSIKIYGDHVVTGVGMSVNVVEGAGLTMLVLNYIVTETAGQ